MLAKASFAKPVVQERAESPLVNGGGEGQLSFPISAALYGAAAKIGLKNFAETFQRAAQGDPAAQGQVLLAISACAARKATAFLRCEHTCADVGQEVALSLWRGFAKGTVDFTRIDGLITATTRRRVGDVLKARQFRLAYGSAYGHNDELSSKDVHLPEPAAPPDASTLCPLDLAVVQAAVHGAVENLTDKQRDVAEPILLGGKSFDDVAVGKNERERARLSGRLFTAKKSLERNPDLAGLYADLFP